QHKVVIDAMGGASAGGMTTIMAAMYGLKGKIKPVTDPSKVGGVRENIFYDSWVLLDDANPGDSRGTFDKVWDTADMNDNVIRSFFNSKFIDTISNRAVQIGDGKIETQIGQLPPYISKDLEMLISICTLRGIPFEINFTTPIGDGLASNKPSFATYDHFTLAHFKLNNGQNPGEAYLWLNPFETQWLTALRKVSIATGAFPFGLRYREFDYATFSDTYLKRAAERIMLKGKENASIDWKNFPNNFSFVAVDGGTVNNDPFGEILQVLEDRYGKTPFDKLPQYGMVMIDPFPNFNESHVYTPPTNLAGIPGNLLSTLRHQATLKRNEIINSFDNNYFLGMIYPVRWLAKDMPDPYPITSASVGAFGGLLDINFRHYDFFLGRNNARNFFRYFFTMPYDPGNNIVHPVHKDWTPEMVEVFKVENKAGKVFLPIIPDMSLFGKTAQQKFDERIHYSIDKKPKYNPDKLFALEGLIKKRLERIVELLPEQKLPGITDPSTKAYPITEALLKKKFGPSFFGKIGNAISKPFQKGIINAAKNKLVNGGTEGVIKYILKDLEDRELLEKK
ncbi:MAG TPA: hypothetical protein VEC12_08335, partial [Bacteroidia bacterium]|nr:hypothetical protein [Bacteroidia bacterium]